MKIGSGSGFGQVERSERSGSQSTVSKSDSGTTAVGGTENVQLSGLSTRLQDLEKTLSASPEFDTDKVNAITQAIRDGKFTVNSEVVADKLLQSVRDLVGTNA